MSLAAPHRWLGLLIGGTIAVAVITSSALAQDAKGADPQVNKLNSRLEELQRVSLADDTSAYIDLMPPRVLKLRADRASAGSDIFIEGLKAQAQVQAAGFDIVSYDFIFNRVARHGVEGGGTVYVIPTLVIMRNDAGTDVVILSDTMALMDDGEWYFLRLDGDADMALLNAAYPSLASLPKRTGAYVPIPGTEPTERPAERNITIPPTGPPANGVRPDAG